MAAQTPNHRAQRIIAVVAGTVIALSCGTNYGFSAWAPQFSEKLQLTATQTNLIGNFGNIGMYAMGIPGGILVDKRNPKWGVLMGCICLACGYFPLKGAYDGGPGSMSVAAMCFFGLLTGVGSCTAFSAALKVCAANWPNNRGTATAFPLSAFGLSAFFYTTMATIAFPDDTSGYLLLLAFGTTAMTFVAMFFLRMLPPPSSSYEALVSGGDERPGFKRKDSNRLVGISPSGRRPSKGSISGDTGAAEETAALVPPHRAEFDEETEDYEVSASSSHSHHHHHRPEITGLQLLRTPKFWQLFVMFSLLCGVGLMTINNIGNTARSLWNHYDDSAGHDFIQQRQLMHVSLLSFCSFLGRLASGIGSDWLIRHHLSRIWMLVVSASVFVLAQVLALTIEQPNHLFLLSGLTGIAYGVLFGVFPAILVDSFGAAGMGLNWGFMTWAPVISGNLFNLAYGSILDKHSGFESHPDGSNGERVCHDGNACYHSAYYITLCAAVAGWCWSLWCIRQERVEMKRFRRASNEARQHET